MRSLQLLFGDEEVRLSRRTVKHKLRQLEMPKISPVLTEEKPEDVRLKALLTAPALCRQSLKGLMRTRALIALTATSCTTTRTSRPFLQKHGVS